MEFIEKAFKGRGCIFCQSKPDLILYRGKNCFVMMNKYPYNNGHMMIVPYSHKPELASLSQKEQCEMMFLTGVAVKILKKKLGCKGANCGINIGAVAGAGIPGHVHMHVVPRWLGDMNFLPVIGNAKSMPEYLKETYKRLKPAFEQLLNNC